MDDKEHLMPTENPPSCNEQPTSAQNLTTPASGPTPYPRQQYPPPPTGPSPYGQHYGYNQPPPGYSSQQGYGASPYSASPPSQQSQQQQQQVVVVSGNQPQPTIVQHFPSYAGHIILSCVVFLDLQPSVWTHRLHTGGYSRSLRFIINMSNIVTISIHRKQLQD